MALGSEYLTNDDSAPKTITAKTHPGMAFFAATGPFGKTCGDCAFKGYRRESQKERIDYDKVARGGFGTLPPRTYRSQGCLKFKKLTGVDGPPIEAEYEACKYFEARRSHDLRRSPL